MAAPCSRHPEGPYDVKKPIAVTSVALTPEHYNRIARLMEHKIPVKLQFNIQNQFFEDQTDSVNVVAEIPGNAKKDEIVMLGAHLDSWHGGTGATDNAAGSAVVMEAARILEVAQPEYGSNGAHGAVERGRGRAAGIEGVREGAFRRSARR